METNLNKKIFKVNFLAVKHVLKSAADSGYVASETEGDWKKVIKIQYNIITDKLKIVYELS